MRPPSPRLLAAALLAGCLAFPGDPAADAARVADAGAPEDAAPPGDMRTAADTAPRTDAVADDAATTPREDAATPHDDAATPRDDAATPPEDSAAPPPDAAASPPLRWRLISAGGASRALLDGEALELPYGSGHTCGLTTDDALYCWGNGHHGQLGTGRAERLARPTAIEPGARWSTVSAGTFNTCAIRAAGDAEAGSLWCWGYDRNGAVGAGEPPVGGSLRPIRVGAENDWTQVSAGGLHTCGLRAGQLYCWGAGMWGQLGHVAVPEWESRAFRPARVGGEADWTSVSAGLAHTCGLRDGGHLFCWGLDLYGRTGQGMDMTGTPAPAPVAPDWRFTAVDTGDVTTCALRDDDRLWCFGGNVFGTLGTPYWEQGDAVAPVAVGERAWSSFSVGGLTACGRQDGQLLCWGAYEDGQVGRGTFFTSAERGVVLDAEGLDAPSVGGMHACALDPAGAAACWGSAADGQLGDGGFSASSVPVRLPGEDWTDIAAGTPSHACGLRGGRLHCWGSNSHGQLGLFAATLETEPTPVAEPGDDARVEAGLDFTCVLDAAGAARCFGANDYAQLGDTALLADSPDPLPLAPAGSERWLSVSLGMFHGCGLTEHGAGGDRIVEAACWGTNTAGQLGRLEPGSAHAPGVVAPEVPWRQVASGGYMGWGLDWAGGLWRWGGTYDVFDHGLPEDELRDRVEPVRHDAHADHQFLSSRGSLTCVVRGPDPAGDVWCWWRDPVGPEEVFEATAERPVVEGPNPRARFDRVFAGGTHYCALTPAGEAYCGGDNEWGQVGDATRVTRWPRLVPVAEPGPWVRLSPGYDFTCGVKADGSAWCWGHGGRGQLGTGAADRDRPTPVLGP